MKKEEKELLLKDLCARLPYGVKIHIGKTQRIEEFGDINLRIGSINNTYADIKPYLFPLSSMTEEQKTFFDDKHIDIDDILGIVAIFAHVNCEEWIEIIDWLNKNHFDYRGLIEKSLALDASSLNIY